MFENYIKVAFRNIRNHKMFSFINIFGLSIGMAASFIILQVVVHELGYDKFHINGDRIYQIQSYNPAQDHDFIWTDFLPELAPHLKESTSAVVNYVRISENNEAIIKNPTSPSSLGKTQRLVFVDTSFFSVFTFPLIQGNPATALSKPKTIVISEKIAEQYFGKQNPIGQKLVYKGKDSFYLSDGEMSNEPFSKGQTELLEVSGVMKNAETNSTLQYDIIGSLTTGLKLDTTNKTPYYSTYLLLDSPKSAQSLLKKLPAACKFVKGFNYNEKDHYKLESLYTLNSSSRSSNNTTVKVYFGIALAILLLALFNYINLTTARSVTRAKEVGLRKTLGVSRLSLFGQFFTESILITLLAFVVAGIITVSFRPLFNELIGLDIGVSILKDIYFIISVTAVLITTALLAGIYPSFILANFSPARVLSGNLVVGNNGALIRRAFIVLQFTISTSLILGSAIVKKQVTFLQNKNPGYNKEQLINITLEGKVTRKSRILKQELKNRYSFDHVSTSNHPVPGSFYGMPYFNPITKEQVFIYTNNVDEDFMETMGMKMLVPLDRNIPATNGYFNVINETAMKELGLTKETAIGKELFSEKNTPSGKIAGVMKNYDYMGPKVRSGIFMFQVHDGKEMRQGMSSLQVRLGSEDNKQEKIALLEKVYRQFEAEKPFKYSFTDDDFNEMFIDDLRISKLVTVFMGIAVFIACLGLFGLATFMTQTRMKEIGIRKVLGATVPNIVGMLSWEFAKLVLIAIFIGLIISYYATDQWLQDFAYRTEISWFMYVVVGLISISIALLTVSLQSLKAALQNPVNALKNN